MSTIVFIPGVWDLLHVGHLTILERAKGLGDRLVVGVPDDDTVREDKGEFPIIPHEDRMRMLLALKCVDVVFPYTELDFHWPITHIRPDILAVGQDWGHELRHTNAEEHVKRYGGRMVMLPYTLSDSTTEIKRRIKEPKCVQY